MVSASDRKLTWATSIDRRSLPAASCEVIEFAALRREVVPPARPAGAGAGRAGAGADRTGADRTGAGRAGAGRAGIENPAHAWLERVARADTLAVLGVRIGELRDLVALHGYVLEPALRSDTAVVIESEHRLTRLAPERFIDPEFEYPYTLERALDAASRLFRGSAPRARRASVASGAAALDAEQRRAVDAHDGVVQVIAPAGSGKTTVLIERVRELLRRGTPADRILCTTFNRDARVELQDRLASAGLGSVAARTFHSIGWWLMREEGLARRNGVRGQLSLMQWKRLCALARREEGEWLEPADARAAISQIKLGLLATAREFRRQAGRHENGATLAHIYELYEQHLVEQGINDFDDLVLVAVRALREDDELRSRWQRRFEHVLVDEYQDIEPAQELLVRILAAPQDGFFCVGDEDQTLYGWRRASVKRMIELDLAYPGLQRISLAHNYRCPPEIVDATRRLIEHNRIRFPKPIHPDPSRSPGDGQALELREHADQPSAAAAVTRVLGARRRDETVVLARTTRVLRTVAIACADVGVAITGPEQIFEPHGAHAALRAYLRLCAAPAEALAEDVALVCRQPGRGLPFESEERVAARLRSGLSFSESLAELPANASQRGRLHDAGQVLGALAAFTRARDFISYLRGPGGLDEFFAEYERTFVGSEQIELEVLDEAEREAAHRTVAEYSELLQRRSERLRAIRDDVNGIELTTIHRSKGRQWPEVHVFACEEKQLPHARALEVDDQQRAAGEGLEAERRLAYVAFTRAQGNLVIHTSTRAASRFLTEAGLQPSAPYVAPKQNGRSSPGAVGGDTGFVLAEAHRVGLSYALRTAPSRAAAIEAAAIAIERRLVGPETTSPKMTVTKMLKAIEQLSDDERMAVIHAAEVDDGSIRVTRLDADARASLVAALHNLASARD